jgi:hypothetical protein
MLIRSDARRGSFLREEPYRSPFVPLHYGQDLQICHSVFGINWQEPPL